MSDRRTELILRIPNLSADSADRVIAALQPLAVRLGGQLSSIDRDHQTDGSALHVGRRTIVAGGQRVGNRDVAGRDFGAAV